MPSDTIEIQAAVCRKFGEPLAIETLRLDPPAEGEIRVMVLASSICHSDIIYMDGGWGGELPAVFGHEVAGVVTDIGPAVRSADIGVGDRVLVSLLRSCGRCEYCEAGIPSQCVTGFPVDSAPRLTDEEGKPVRAGLRVGGFAESVVVDASQVVKIPADVADEAACLISCGVMTGFGAAINTAKSCSPTTDVPPRGHESVRPASIRQQSGTLGGSCLSRGYQGTGRRTLRTLNRRLVRPPRGHRAETTRAAR